MNIFSNFRLDTPSGFSIIHILDIDQKAVFIKFSIWGYRPYLLDEVQSKTMLTHNSN